MNDILYNFPVMEKAKKDRERQWDIYNMNNNKDSNDPTLWQLVKDETWGDIWDDYMK